MNILAVIDSADVPERTYFLEALNTSAVIWTIRMLLVVLGVLAFLVYIKTRKK